MSKLPTHTVRINGTTLVIRFDKRGYASFTDTGEQCNDCGKDSYRTGYRRFPNGRRRCLVCNGCEAVYPVITAHT